MQRREIERFRTILKAKQAQVAMRLQDREGIIVEKSADEFDEIGRAVEREIAIQNLDRESRLLREIRGALRRMDEDVFGTCLHCDEEISRRRLEAVPWTPFCLQCQEAADQGDERVIEAAEIWLADAA
jgi:DnaK suppressor protein